MDLVQVWKCQCGSQRQWGNAAQPEFAHGTMLLLCEKSCGGIGKHMPHKFMRTGVRRWDGPKQKFVIERVQ